MKGIELLPLIKASSCSDRFSLNLMKWVQKHKNRDLLVAIATENVRVFDPDKTQTPYLYIAYSLTGDLFGSRLSEILCNGSKTDTWCYPSKLGFEVVPDWWDRYIVGGKCFIDPEHYLYHDKDRWQLLKDGNERLCVWCGEHRQHKHTEMIPQESWRRQIEGDFGHA